MSGLLVVVCVWLVCGGIKGGVERYLEGRGKRVSGGQRRLLTILCVLATLAAAVMERVAEAADIGAEIGDM